MDDLRNIKKSDYFKQNTDIERINYLLSFAILAPSFYNSQPWLFKVKDNKCTIFLNPKIQLKESDPDSRNLYASLGCAIENLVIAAKYFSVSLKVQSILENGKYSASEVSFIFNKESTSFENNQKVDKEYEKLTDYILRRHNHFGFFKSEVVPPDLISRLSTLTFLDEFSGLRLDFLANKDQLTALGKISKEAIIKKYNNALYRKELSDWLRGSREVQKDGISRKSLNIYGLFSSIITFFAGATNVGSYVAKSEAERIKSAPVVCIFAVNEDDEQLVDGQFTKNLKTKPELWISVGRLAERLLLEFSARGYNTSFFNSIVMLDESCSEIKKLVGMTERPQLMFGVGHILESHQFTPRFKVQDRLKVN